MFLVCCIDYGLKNSGLFMFNFLNFQYLCCLNVKTINIFKYIYSFKKRIKLFLIGYSNYIKNFNILINIKNFFLLKNFIKIFINTYNIELKLVNEINSSKYFLKKNNHKYSACYIFKNYLKFIRR